MHWYNMHKKWKERCKKIKLLHIFLYISVYILRYEAKYEFLYFFLGTSLAIQIFWNMLNLTSCQLIISQGTNISNSLKPFDLWKILCKDL